MKLNFKSLAFYAGSIGFVVALFSFATAYGEANLKAPNKLEGRYRIAAQSLPGCLKADALILTIQQSRNLSQWLVIKRRPDEQNLNGFSEKVFAHGNARSRSTDVIGGSVSHR